MRRATAALGLGLFLAGLFAGAATTALAEHEGDMVAVDRAWYRKVVDQLIKDADEIEDKNEDNPDKNSRKAIRERLVAMRKDLVAMRGDLDKAPDARPGGPVEVPTMIPTPPGPPPTPVGPIPMNPDEFGDFLKAIKKSTYSSDKLALVKDVTKNAWFTTDQVVKVMNEFVYSNEKVQSAAAMYPRVVDQQNWFKVYGALTYSSDRDKLRKLTTGQ